MHWASGGQEIAKGYDNNAERVSGKLFLKEYNRDLFL